MTPAFSSPTGSQGRGGWVGADHALWLRQQGTQDSCLPPLSAHTTDYTPCLPLSLFSPEPPDRGCPDFGVRFLSGLLRFALLTSAAQDYLPKSKQNGLTPLTKRQGRQAGLPRGLCYANQQGRLGLLKLFYMAPDWWSLMTTEKSTHLT